MKGIESGRLLKMEKVENGRKKINKNKKIIKKQNKKKKLKKKPKPTKLKKAKMKNTQKQNSNEQGNSFYVLLKISKNPQNQFEIIQEPPKKERRNCKEGKIRNCKRQFGEEKRKFSKEERLEMIEKRINFLKQKLEKIEENDPRKQSIQNRISFFHKEKRHLKMEKQLKRTTNHHTKRQNNLI